MGSIKKKRRAKMSKHKHDSAYSGISLDIVVASLVYALGYGLGGILAEALFFHYPFYAMGH